MMPTRAPAPLAGRGFGLAFAVVLVAACASHGAPARRDTISTGRPSSTPIRDSALRAELLSRLEADQAVRLAVMRKQQEGRTPDSLDFVRMIAVDTANTAWLERIVGERGWPARSRVGADGANAAFLLVQHADRDTAFQARVLPELEKAFAAGEAEGQQVALLADRLAVARGQPQIYGSQADVSGGRVTLKPIADSAGVDARRARMGLPPLAAYLRILDSLYTERPKP